MAGLIQLASMFLVYDTYLRFKEISKGKKRFLLVVTIPFYIVYFLFLIVGVSGINKHFLFNYWAL
ncbi:hypothetical protein DOE78_04450 [Bacillus sp. Y1]|nr:hypothetical protein DOE78_04450 [Bacillus sp. Y1]